MKNLDWMISTCSKFSISKADAELILVNQGLDPDGEVDIVKVKTALVNEFALIIPLANISEGGYSVSWNMDAVKLWYKAMCEELGIAPVSAPKIRNKSNRW